LSGLIVQNDGAQ